MTLNATGTASYLEDTPRLEHVALVARTVSEETGLLEDSAASTVNWTPIPMHPGDRLTFSPGSAPHRIFFYAPDVDEDLSSKYCYDEESNWTTYDKARSNLVWTTDDLIAEHDGFVRVEFQTDEYAGGFLNAYITFERTEPCLVKWPRAFAAECNRVTSRVEELREAGDCVLALIADIHHAVGDTWHDTAHNLKTCCEIVKPDAVVQLGDVTDGIAPAEVTRQLAGEVLRDLQELGAPVYGCIGNHDVNYFRGNKDLLGAADCARLYLDRPEPSFFEDVPASKLRLLFVHSYNHDHEERYGFSKETVKWLKRTLRRTPNDWDVLVFSHVPPLAEFHYWSDTIENSDKVIRALERFNAHGHGRVLGYIHGHSHADQVYRTRTTFPIISVGCAKFEYFQDRKPAGSTTFMRSRDDETQDLWDFLVVKPQAGMLEFVRFGAGEDRSVSS